MGTIRYGGLFGEACAAAQIDLETMMVLLDEMRARDLTVGHVTGDRAHRKITFGLESMVQWDGGHLDVGIVRPPDFDQAGHGVFFEALDRLHDDPKKD